MLWVIVVATLAVADPPGQVAVVPVLRADVVSPEVSAQLERWVREALTTAGVTVTAQSKLEGQDPAACETNKACFALIGRALGAFAVVRVEGAMVGREVAVLLQALESTTGQPLGEASFVAQLADLGREVPLRVAPLAKAIKERIPPPRVVLEPKAPLDAPLNPLALSATPVTSRSMAPVWVTGVGAVVFAGTAAGLLAMGASARACLNGPTVNGSATVCVPASEAAAVGQRADLGATAGTVVGGIALALVATTIVEYLVLKD